MTTQAASAGRPARASHDRGRLALIIAVLIAVLAAVGAVLLFRHAVEPSNFPPFVATDKKTVINRYSGPWITAAGGLLLIALLALTFGGIQLARRRIAA